MDPILYEDRETSATSPPAAGINWLLGAALLFGASAGILAGFWLYRANLIPSDILSKPGHATTRTLAKEAPPSPPSDVDKTEQVESLFIQVGAFRDPERAVALTKELKQAGFPARLLAGGALRRVVVGPFSTELQASRGRLELEKHGYPALIKKGR
ncbi:MAG: SPOR domain-containing protein [Acidobacteria bacterium]|nr:SPOR domain-containing protein [Acidobacteriota bacterium]